METIYIRGGDKDSKGVHALQYHLRAKGHKVVRSKDEPYDRIVCWGVSTRDIYQPKPALNGNVNLYNKLQAIELFAEKDLTVPTLLGLKTALTNRRLFEQTKPWFGRKVHHEKGDDITLCEDWPSVRDVVEQRKAEYFSVYVPHTEEIRVWTFKDKAFAIYHKQYKNHGIDNYKT